MTYQKAKIFVAAIAFFGVALQFPLAIMAGRKLGQSDLFTFFNFFGYFTILANILVVWSVRSKSASFDAALAAYIAVVGITYSLLLRAIWNPEGWYRVADSILHDVVPPLYVAAWVFLAPKERIAWGDLRWWLVFPLVYLLYSMVRGAWLGWYPYPFINVATLGLPQALLNSFVMTVGFVVLAAGVIAWSRRRAG